MTAREVGITTTVPSEVLLAAGARLVDLNNRFVTSGRAASRVELAERRGFPRSICAWVKGIYGTVVEEGIRTVLGVAQGDCSLTHALLEVLGSEGVEVILFDYPHRREAAELDAEIARLEERFGVRREDSERVREALLPLRRDLADVDRLMGESLPPGLAEKAHLALLSSSDFSGDAWAFASAVKGVLAELRESSSTALVSGPARREPMDPGARAFGPAKSPRGRICESTAGAVEADPLRTCGSVTRLALAGVPPIVPDLFERLERLGARVVLSEMPREFAFVRPAPSLVEQYLSYTYPYDVFHRLDGLVPECRARGVAGIVHYVQSFCFRGVQDRLLRERWGGPVLTLECDRPGRLDERAVARIEAFVEVLRSGAASSSRPARKGACTGSGRAEVNARPVEMKGERDAS